MVPEPVVPQGVVPSEAVLAANPRTVRRPVMLQGWHDLASVHWRYDPEVVQALLPDGFRVDTHDGAAWVGLLPFYMRRIRVPGLPAFGPLSTFPETNIRTYLVDPDGRRGVWFCSLDVTRLLPALVARATYRLPYCWARMSIEQDGDTWTYRSARRWPRGEASSAVRVRVGAALPAEEVAELDHFLTARWALGSRLGRRLLWAEVDHEPWVVHRAELLELDETLLAAAGLPAPTGDPVVLWSPGVEVRIGRPRTVARRGGLDARPGRGRYLAPMTEPTTPVEDDHVSLRIAATPERVYDIVSDVTSMGRLSPECTGGRWLDGVDGPSVGARFKGTNKRGPVRWSTTNTVVAAERGRDFAFETKQSGVRWRYQFEPDGDGTVVTESRVAWRDRPLVARVGAALLMGGADSHDDELRAGMRATLERLRALAEAPSA